MLRLIQILFCRHDFENIPHGPTLATAAGLKVLHFCPKCTRLKWLSIHDTKPQKPCPDATPEPRAEPPREDTVV